MCELADADDALARANEIAHRIASYPRDAILYSYETTLSDGLRAVHTSFRSLASSNDSGTRVCARS